jgi:23S rRNA (cytosine1962-C5)-methyltransferase
VYRKVFEKDRSVTKPDNSLYQERPFWGDASPSEVTVVENGLKYEVRPYSGTMTGLFLDQRENRKKIAQISNGKSLLNLFAFSCSFSVAAVGGGARRSTNVDLSAKYLAWGKKNFELNAFALDEHRFFADDAREYLRRAAKRGESFDIVVLDPPSFSRNKNKVFRLEQEAAELIRAASDRVARGGYFFFSCNFSGWDETTVSRLLSETLPAKTWGTPLEIKKPVDFYADRLLKSALFKRE